MDGFILILVSLIKQTQTQLLIQLNSLLGYYLILTLKGLQSLLASVSDLKGALINVIPALAVLFLSFISHNTLSSFMQTHSLLVVDTKGRGWGSIHI